MTPEQFRRVESLFERACTLPLAERERWLHQQCSDDLVVLRKVERMLTEDERGGVMLEEPAMGEGFHVLACSLIESRLYEEFEATGRYRIHSLLGEGGFGSVYRAEQLHPVQRSVAIKVIKFGMDTRRVLARFEMERQTLARMNHPGIAKCLYAGTTPSGRPYFVMELIDGVPITNYCDRENLNLHARVQLFAQVCEAVRHAHQKGILHRDIKPSNVLVTSVDRRPQPVIIDFGISRALDADLHEMTQTTDQMIGTLEYISPEQAEGSRDIDTRSDIYSLGVLLYELLTGTTPIDRSSQSGSTLVELQRMIREYEPPLPSVRVRKSGNVPLRQGADHRIDPISHSRKLRGELDWIVMKAIEKDRTQRYETVDAFLDDVYRHLRDEPVLARPHSAMYRIGKFARRHRGAVGAGAALLLTMALGVAGTTYGMIQARREAALARAESQVAIAVSDFLNHDLLTAIETERLRHDITMREFLDVASQRIDGRFDDRPRVELSIRCALGRVYSYLGAFEHARHHLERAVELARTTPDADPRSRIEAPLALAHIYHRAGRPVDAIPLAKEALQHAIELEGETGEYTLLALNMLAQVSPPEDAEAIYQRILKVRRGLNTPKNERELLVVMSNLAVLYLYKMQDRVDDALAILHEMQAEMMGELAADDPARLKVMLDISNAFRQRHQFDEADAALAPVIALIANRFGDHHPNTLVARSELASLRTDQGRYDEAIQIRLDIIDEYQRLYGRTSPATHQQIEWLCDIYDRAGKLDDALKWRNRLAEIEQ